MGFAHFRDKSLLKLAPDNPPLSVSSKYLNWTFNQLGGLK